MITLGILTISTSASTGKRVDLSGDLIKEMLAPPLFRLDNYEVVPDGIAKYNGFPAVRIFFSPLDIREMNGLIVS